MTLKSNGPFRIGRPNKYADLLMALEDEELYSPSKIANFAASSGYIKDTSVEKINKAKRNIRFALAKFAKNHNFPSSGDGILIIKGQGGMPGWFGKHWKEPIKKKAKYIAKFREDAE